MTRHVLALVGIGLLGARAGRGAEGVVGGAQPLLGVFLALAAGVGYAFYSWAGARLIARGQGSRSVFGALFAVAAMVLVPAFVILGPGPLVQPRGLIVLVYLALIPMALAYLLFGYGLRGLSASTATTLALSEPVVATLLATVVLHERIPTLGWAGLLLIMLGLTLVTRPTRLASR